MKLFSWWELHAAVTHFPIALLIGGTFFDFAAAVKKRSDWRIASFWMLALAVAASVASLLTGWMTGLDMYSRSSSQVFVWHRALGFATAGLAGLLLFVRWRKREYESVATAARPAVLLLSLLVSAAAGLTGYFGGRMVSGDSGASATTTVTPATTPASTPQATPQFDPTLVKKGEKLYISENCSACHQINGQGKKRGPDLTFIGREEPSVQWHVEHLKNPKSKDADSTMPSYDYLKPDELKALATYLASRR